MHRVRLVHGLMTVLLAMTALSCGRTDAEKYLPTDSRPESDSLRGAVQVREPACPTIKTGQVDAEGRAITVSCATCHSTRPANTEVRLGAPLKQFHQGQIGKHGNLTCVSCHNASDGYGSLRFADGRRLPYEHVMQLCAQCHGPQFRDYEHGAHGGMNGFWDLTKGNRTRNNCIDCHDPHAPKYPTVTPARGPNDRFLERPKHE